ncbi:MAG: hypothetical protein MUE42_05230 [Opitutaceae bacterium]|jgi:hypothetical protein|nr:hypothetical protein [Opitutaceae bacterium]
MNIHLDDIYVRTDDFQTRVEGLEFTPQVWAVFAKLEQARTATQVAAELNLPIEAVNQAFSALGDAQLIRKKVVGWNAFASAASSASPPAQPAAVNPAHVRHPASTLPDLAPAPADADKSSVCFRIASPAALQAIVAPVVHLRLAPPQPEAAPVTGGCKLRPILDAISASAGGGIPGQLLVYKVFLQLPADLMKAAGLTSLAAVTDETTIANPALREALVEAAKQHAKIDISALAAA